MLILIQQLSFFFIKGYTAT